MRFFLLNRKGDGCDHSAAQRKTDFVHVVAFIEIRIAADRL
jgi:hypothetical protein